MSAAVTRLHAAVTENAPRPVVEERLTAAVLLLGRHASTKPPPVPARPGRTDLAALDRARALLRQRFADNISADDPARAAGCSRFTLYRGFRTAYGFAPSDYQRDLRLRRACPGTRAVGVHADVFRRVRMDVLRKDCVS
ncbi:hypothetical protein [Streptomyces sp. NPDC058751]|uniref:hypothetical protein n=1 Tax=Streptomyces sp. NPDC058751 TaxID=3346623 RepID=UPI0036A1F188